MALAAAGRNRWVVYKNASHWRSQDPSTVSAEWHAWLHYVSDENPSNVSRKPTCPTSVEIKASQAASITHAPLPTPAAPPLSPPSTPLQPATLFGWAPNPPRRRKLNLLLL